MEVSEREVAGVVWDVDNTVYSNGKKQVAPDVVDAFSRLTVPHFVATRRSLPQTRQLEKWGVPLDNFAALDNGATIAHLGENEIVSQEWLEAEQVEEIVRKVGSKCVWLSTATLDKRIKFEASDINPLHFTYSQASPTVFGVCLLSQKEYLNESLRTVNTTDYQFMKFDNSNTHGCFQVNRPGINKGRGVMSVAAFADLEGKNLLAIGDAFEGDGEIFSAVRKIGRGICIAVGNADDRLKSVADDIVASVDDMPGGFTEAMERYRLLKAPPLT